MVKQVNNPLFNSIEFDGVKKMRLLTDNKRIKQIEAGDK
jgi:hypothetical protein